MGGKPKTSTPADGRLKANGGGRRGNPRGSGAGGGQVAPMVPVKPMPHGAVPMSGKQGRKH